MAINGAKIKSTCKHLAKCGLVSLNSCKTRRAGLLECDGCKLVTRLSDRWKMIDGKKNKRCGCCEKFLPIEMYYQKTIRKPDGRVYESTQGVCKMCKSQMGKEAYKRKVLGLK